MHQVIVFQGDSITDACRQRDDGTYNPGMGYPTLVKSRLGFDYPLEYDVINRGVSGDRIVDLYCRIKKDTINLKPDYLSVLIGINDVWHEADLQNGVDAEKFEMVYDLFLSEIEAARPGIKLIILEPFVLEGTATNNTEAQPNRLEYFRKETALRAAASKRVAEKHHAIFVPLQEKFTEAAKATEPSWWLVDGVHPNAAGHELIAREWLKAFETIRK